MGTLGTNIELKSRRQLMTFKNPNDLANAIVGNHVKKVHAGEEYPNDSWDDVFIEGYDQDTDVDWDNYETKYPSEIEPRYEGHEDFFEGGMYLYPVKGNKKVFFLDSDSIGSGFTTMDKLRKALANSYEYDAQEWRTGDKYGESF